MMPGMDGPAVLSEIRNDPDPRVAATPVVVLTSDDRADHRYVARHAGAQAFINKATPLNRMFEALAPYLPSRASPPSPGSVQPSTATGENDPQDNPQDARQ
jgi:CheY-like chemotaxis protein